MNDKSIFKKLTCPECRKWISDATGKAAQMCEKCGIPMVLSDRWHVRITRNGKTTLRAISTRRQEAVDYLHAAKDAARRGQLLPGEEKAITWSEARDSISKFITASAIGEDTKRNYRITLENLNGHFTCNLQDITVKQVEDFRDMRLATVSPKTVFEEIRFLRWMLTQHCRWYPVRMAPGLHAVATDLKQVKMPKVSNKRTRFLTEQEVSLILEHCVTPSLKLAVQIALSTGLRSENIMSLRWDQIDYGNRTITYQADEMKSGRRHVSPLMHQLATALREWRQEQAKTCISRYVFPSTVPGEHAGTLIRPFRKTLDKCNVVLKKAKLPLLGDDVVFHTLRHTFASHFLMNGGDLSTLSELLNHASIQITKDRYGHLSSEHKLKAIDQFSGVFFNR